MAANKPALRVPGFAIDLAVFAASLLVYAFTLIPSVLSADNGEFQLVAWKLGIAHPPGYPLYTIAGFLFSRLFASPAFALNLLSAILASITLALVSRTVRAATGSALAGIASTIVLGSSTTFWAQATTANIRMPTALFTAWCVYALVAFQQAVAGASEYEPYALPDRYLRLFALAFSLGLGHHPSILFPGIFFIIYLILIDPALLRQPRRWIKPGVVFLSGLLVLLYLPLRGASGGALANGEATTYLAQPDKLVDYVLARGFEGDFFYFINTRPDQFGDRLGLLPTLFTFQFNIGALIFGTLGIVVLAGRNWRLLVLLSGGIAVHTFVTLTYRAPQTVEYMLPAYVLFAVLIGCGLGSPVWRGEAASPLLTTERLSENSPPRHQDTKKSFEILGVSVPWWLTQRSFVNYGLPLLAAFAGLARGLDNLPSYVWLSQNEDTRQYAEALLNDAPQNAIILSNWHWANPMWYLQQVEKARPDVDVVYVFPRGSELLATSWLNQIAESEATGQPVVVDMFFREEFAASPYFFEPVSREAFLVHSRPQADMPAGFTPLEADFTGRFRLLGYRLLNDRAQPGEPLTLFLAYRVETQPDRDYSFFVHLVDPAGRVIGQSDRTLLTTHYGPDDVIVERFFVAPLPGAQPGEYTLATGIYSNAAGRIIQLRDRVQVARASVDLDSPLTVSPPTSAIALSHGIYFLGVTPTSSAARSLTPGSRLTLDLRFLATRPLTRDFVVSVQMVGEGYSWRAASDSVPALGAIPTLKWIAGSDIVDRHFVDIPSSASPGPATVSLIMYDNFTQQPLALLDEQLIQQGQAIPLGTWIVRP